MQKQVSKRRLSILALSILLVLSLALTSTFAVFGNKSATVTGTVSFEGSIEISATASDTINVSIDIGSGVVTFDTGASQLAEATIDADGAPFYWKATLGITAGSNFFTFDTSDLPQLNNTPAANTSTSTLITWAGGSSVTTTQTLDIEDMLEDLALTLDYAAIGAGSPTGTLTLTIYAQYNAFA